MQRSNRVTTTPLPAEVSDAVKELDKDFLNSNEDSDEEDFELLIGFDPEKGREKLFGLSNSIRVTISHEQQKEVGIEVGIQLSHQYPWRQLSKKFFSDHLSTDTFEMKTLKEKLREVDDDLMMLIGFASHLSDENQDVFVIFCDEETCKEACDIIKRLEAFERRKLQREVVKYSRPYESMGSEQEIDNYVRKKRTNLVDVELQSVYPMRYSSANFTFRLSDDVRDGYSELLPSRNSTKNENVVRKMIDRSIQSGAMKKTEEQQTDPTFPTNAWSQYIYDLDEEIERTRQAIKLAASDDQDKKPKNTEKESQANSRRKKSKGESPMLSEPKPDESLRISKPVENLLETLDFNQIDMYRNDYPFIAKSEILKYRTPFIEEICCFVDIEKCIGRNVTSIDWHPQLSGICAVAYGYNLRAKMMRDESDLDVVKRTILESNPVLIWSLDDQLYPKLELEAMREISCISFCPYDGNVVVGGCVSGRIIIWDLSSRLEKVETDEHFRPPEKQRIRSEIREFMKWRIDESNKIVMPSAISQIDKSHDGAVTNIKWLATNYQCTTKGLLKTDRESTIEYRQFVTTSTDGNIFFWSLDWEPSGNEAAKLIKKPNYKVELPEELKEDSSPFKNIDSLFSYHFKVVLSKPIISFTFNEGEFKYEPLTKMKHDVFTRISHKVTRIKKTAFNPSMIIGFSTGETVMLYWDGNDFSQGAILDPKTMIVENFANLHDGPVMQIQKNSFIPGVFSTIGGNIFSVWHEDFRSFPILWRRRKSRIISSQWSPDRPSVISMVFESGILEIWDLNSRTDIPSLEISLAGNLLSEIIHHKLCLPSRLFAIADHNTNLRIFVVPKDFVEKQHNEIQIFSKFINEEIVRKKNQEKWKLEWFDSNKDIIEAKHAADLEIFDENEKKERMKREIEEKRRELAEAEAKKRAKKNARKLTYDLPERLEKKWNEQNYKRLLSIMMERKNVDRELLEKQTKILKDRMIYNDEKGRAIKDNFSTIDNDLSTIRARLIPVKQHETSREEIVLDSVEKNTKSSLNYKLIEVEALGNIECQPEMKSMSIFDILRRCKENRDLLNMSLGGGQNAKFEKFRRERQFRMSRVSSISNIQRSHHSQSLDFKERSTVGTPSSMQ